MQDTLDIVKKADENINRSEYDLAIDLLNLAIEQIEEDPLLYEIDYPLVYKKFGECYGLMGEIEKAHEYFEKGIEYSKRTFNIVEKGNIYASLASLELDTGDLYKALKYVAKAEDIIGEIRGKKFSAARAIIFKVLGEIYIYEVDIEKAEKYYKRARTTFKRLKLEEEQIRMFLKIINIRIIQAKYIDASLLLENGLLEEIENKCPNVLYKYYLMLGKLETETKQYKYARETLDKALKYAKEYGKKRDMAEISEIMGDLSTKEGNLDNAKNFYSKALQRYMKHRRKPHIERVEEKLGDSVS